MSWKDQTFRFGGQEGDEAGVLEQEETKRKPSRWNFKEVRDHWAAQKGRCAVCGAELRFLAARILKKYAMPFTQAVVDRDRQTGRVERILCRGCMLKSRLRGRLKG